MSNQPASSKQHKIKCKGCGKEVQLLLSHLERTKHPCKALYDMDALKSEAKRLQKEQMATRNRQLYHNDPDVSPRKRIASAEYYKLHKTEKKASMAAYNENHRAEINEAKRKRYLKEKQALMQHYHEAYVNNEIESPSGDTILEERIDHLHSKEEQSLTCQICDKTITSCKSNLERHMREIHGGEKYKCEKCPAAFTRNSELQRHKEEGWHHLSYFCSQCKKNITFKSFGGLVEHVIVKQSEKEIDFPDGSKFVGKKFTKKKSGIVLTCKSTVESIQLEEGRYLELLSKHDKKEAYQRREKRKEEILNAGLEAAEGSYKKPNVIVCSMAMLDKKTHQQEEESMGFCKFCLNKIPFQEDEPSKEKEEKTIWQLQNWW